MVDLKIGELISGAAGRDAIHVAVAPIVADGQLQPGDHVGLTTDGRASRLIKPFIGAVDPFLKTWVAPGEKFWLFLYPNTVTSLRHQWTHPAFTDAVAKPLSDLAVSTHWLRDYATLVNPYTADSSGNDAAYEQLLDDLRSGELTYHGRDMHNRGDLIDEAGLQHHASVVLGHPVVFENFKYFSCTC